ncbi:linoleate 13S-lipoxygenase [Trifolium repens]|nr:linoleate 13S-lipoxygenase [Trifolium repens]
MANVNTFTDLAHSLLRGPMNPNPTTARDKLIAELQIKYRTFYVEFDINQGAVMLAKMFSRDFGHDVRRFATLIDPLGNQFQVLVEIINGNIYLTWGWFGQLIDPPTFVPPMKFKLDLSHVGTEFVDDLPENTKLLSYTHQGSSFGIEYEKKLNYYDINNGFLMPYEDFGEKVLHKTTTTLNLVDDYGNKWNCVLIYVGGYVREKNENLYLIIFH